VRVANPEPEAARPIFTTWRRMRPRWCYGRFWRRTPSCLNRVIAACYTSLSGRRPESGGRLLARSRRSSTIRGRQRGRIVPRRWTNGSVLIVGWSCRWRFRGIWNQIAREGSSIIHLPFTRFFSPISRSMSVSVGCFCRSGGLWSVLTWW